jgi:DNA-damage-inducible protein D
LKKKLSKEGSQLYEKIVQLKFVASDGKKYATDCLDTPNILRLIQSIPSPKAEPFKQWLAKVGYERMKEIGDPEQSLDRARENWQKMGHSEKVDSTTNDGTGNAKQTHRLLETKGVESRTSLHCLPNHPSGMDRLNCCKTQRSKRTEIPQSQRPYE